MVDKRDGVLKPDYKMTMYSAHDTTVASMLITLGVFDLHTPPCTSLVLFELWKNDLGKYLVKVRVGFYSVISEF
jgi:lysosomal acid phosphatase